MIFILSTEGRLSIPLGDLLDFITLHNQDEIMRINDFENTIIHISNDDPLRNSKEFAEFLRDKKIDIQVIDIGDNVNSYDIIFNESNNSEEIQ